MRLFLLGLICLLSSLPAQAETMPRSVPTGEVLDVLHFSSSSSSLNSSLRKKLDAIFSELGGRDLSSKVLRFEGYVASDHKDARNWALAATRAMSAEHYWSLKQNDTVPVYVTAYVSGKGDAEGDRVEVVLYDDIFMEGLKPQLLIPGR